MFNLINNYQPMNKTIISVPMGVRYLSDWNDFSLSNFKGHYILNKKLTGCGFTEFCIRCQENVIILSPRKLLLQNKKDQHSDIFYFRNEFEKTVNFEKKLVEDNDKLGHVPKNLMTIDSGPSEEEKGRILELKKEVREYWESCSGPCPGLTNTKPCKILVTYDSFRHVKEALGNSIIFFKIVVDEFQSVFGDSRFKPDTELELMYQLNDVNYVCFVSATPMLEKYLAMMDEFKDLPYFELDWESEDPGRVVRPIIDVKIISDNRSVESEAGVVIQKYLDGKFELFHSTGEDGKLFEIASTEAVLYLNSVSSIARLINKFSLTPDNTNVLCAKTEQNEKTRLKAFGLGKRELKKKYG